MASHWVLGISLATCLGCGVELTKDEGQRRTAGGGGIGGVMTESPMESQAKPAQEASSPVEPTPTEPAPAQAVEAAPADNATATPGTVQEKAAVGAGKKGRYEGSGFVVTPIRAFFRAEQRIIYDNIAYNLKLYQAANGNFPKTQEEFDEQIIAPNQIKLPELPAGHRYVYDPKKGELMVEKPAP
jgi:hypothetical protein